MADIRSWQELVCILMICTLCDNITLTFRFVSEKRLGRFIPFRSVLDRSGLIGQESTCIKR